MNLVPRLKNIASFSLVIILVGILHECIRGCVQ